jgi:hypothetical protein
VAQRRNLGDILHHFISEEEQREAREGVRRARERHRAESSPARCWILAASPRRPLSCALALDLAAVLSRGGTETRILAPCQSEVCAHPSTTWSTFASGEPDGLRDALEELPVGSNTLLLISPEALGSVLAELDRSLLAGVLLPVDAAPWGLARALRWLRNCAIGSRGVRIGAVIVAAESRERANELYRKLASAARRQIGLEIENFGEVQRDSASFRSLLRGVPVLDLDAGAGSSRSLAMLGRRLAPEISSRSEAGE